MPATLLRTKLFLPPLRSQLVPRPHLIARLNESLQQGHKLTLVSAPAGFGKSTLVGEWARQLVEPDANRKPQSAIRNAQVCWLSLDEGDNDLIRFLTYFVAALQTIDPAIGQGALVALQTPGETDVETVLTTLLNETSQLSADVILILDDYHVIESPPVDQALAYLLAHLPGQMHLVLASRIDPSLPLSRLRARGQMSEIRAHNLRFTADEAAAFLNQVMGFGLSPQEIAGLESRTEGWIAGLQLAALSMQGLQPGGDLADFVARFTGSNRYIQDYLADEVLRQRPPGTRDFLLQTSILRRLSGPLCDAVRFGVGEFLGETANSAVSPENNSQVILESLEAANLFIVPLDNERRWYRYHHLFAELLAQRLRQTAPEQIPELHHRASLWHEQEGDIDEAIRHGQAAGDTARVLSIIEEHWQVIVHRGELTRLKQLLDALGPGITRNSAPLSMAYCWYHNLSGHSEAIPAHIADIRALEQTTEADAGLLPMKLAVIPSLVQTMEAIVALHKGQAGKAKAHAQQAISLIPDSPNPNVRGLLHGAAGYRLAEAYRALGELDEAIVVLLDVLEMLKASENYIGVGTTILQIVDMYRKSGKIQRAIALCEETLSFIAAQQWQDFQPSGIVNVILASLQAEVGDYEAARHNLQIGRPLVEPLPSPAMTRLLQDVQEKLGAQPPSPQPLVEPLSVREIEVLQLVAQGLSNRAIGDRLFLALDTVKGHNRNIYGKLGVKNRAQAVSKAISLNILPQ